MRPCPARFACVLSALCVVVGLGCSRSPRATVAEGGSAKPVQKVDPTSLVGVTPREPPPVSERKLAHEFYGATAWLNAARPLTRADFKGRVVVVDFWTSCCINCLHTLPTLGAIEKKFGKEAVVVVGVHSPKFEAESERERLRSNVAEYGINHPVAIDGSMAIWNRWNVKSWPTIFVLDAEGRIVWSGSGEPDPKELEAVVAGALVEGAAAGILERAPIDAIVREKRDETPLAFPGKITSLVDGYAISDTGHNRIVFVDKLGAEGKVTDIVGSGLRGMTDGAYADASFASPNGITEGLQVVYVADTENHAIRAIDRRTKTVTTLAGTGSLGHGPLGGERTKARETALRSPWDLLWASNFSEGPTQKGKGTLFVALAGSHQIAAFDPPSGTVRAFAGDGRERRDDGIGLAASFAQPSGLATDGTVLYVADSETSSVRSVSYRDASVRTLAGQDLFVFGDVDGKGESIRLQHPMGLAFGDGALFVADTYNSKIKRFDPRAGTMTSVFGGNDHKQLFEPQGLLVKDVDGKPSLFVSDTHHHRIVIASTKGAGAVPVELRGLSAPVRGVAVEAPKDDLSGNAQPVVIEVPIRASGPSKVHVTWKMPVGTGVNEDAPFKVRWTTSEGLERAPEDIREKGSSVQNGFDVTVSPVKGVTEAMLVGVVDIVVCDSANHSVCVPVRRKVEMTLVGMPKGGDATVVVPLPEARAAAAK